MICKTKTDKKELVLITLDDSHIMAYMLRGKPIEAYLPSYPVDDGTFGVYPEMVTTHTWESLEAQGMTVSKAGVVLGIAPLMVGENLEEGISGEVKFFYQVLLDDGTLCLVRSFATLGVTFGIQPNGDYISMPCTIPGWVAWVQEKRTEPLDKYDHFVADMYAKRKASESNTEQKESQHG